MDNPVVCDARPVCHETYSYISSCITSLLIGRYQIILLADRGTCVNNFRAGLHSKARLPRVEPVTCSLHIQCHNLSMSPSQEGHSLTYGEHGKIGWLNKKNHACVINANFLSTITIFCFLSPLSSRFLHLQLNTDALNSISKSSAATCK